MDSHQDVLRLLWVFVRYFLNPDVAKLEFIIKHHIFFTVTQFSKRDTNYFFILLFYFIFLRFFLSQWEFFPQEIGGTFPEENQLRQLCYPPLITYQPSKVVVLVVYMQYFCVTIPPAVRPTLLGQMDMGSNVRKNVGACCTHTERCLTD